MARDIVNNNDVIFIASTYTHLLFRYFVSANSFWNLGNSRFLRNSSCSLLSNFVRCLFSSFLIGSPVLLAVPANFVLPENVSLAYDYNVTKHVGGVYSVSNRSEGCSKVCENDCLRRSVQSGHMVAERGVKPLSDINCSMKWDALQLPILSPNTLQVNLLFFRLIVRIY